MSIFSNCLKYFIIGFPSWLGRLSIRCCHYCGTGCIPGPGTSACFRHGKKKKVIIKNFKGEIVVTIFFFLTFRAAY